MKTMTPVKMAEICGGVYYGNEEPGNKEITGIVRDNREIANGNMFVAIKGARVDGNQFVPAAYEAGALCCMSEEPPTDAAKPYIQVDNYLEALQKLAIYYRQLFQGKVIGVTGSVGKTTTKEMLASVLSTRYNTLKTDGNYNNELGVPLTLFRLNEKHEIAIVEMGISDFGEMSRLTAIANPDMCVISNIGQCHLEQLGDRDGVLKAKTEIFEGLRQGGKAYLNGDDDKLITVSDVHGQPPVFFGTDSINAVHPIRIQGDGLKGTNLTVSTAQGEIEIYVPVPGRHMVTNALAAVAIGLDLGLSGEEIARGIADFSPVEGHGNVFTTEKFIVMNDCYNANPMSMRAGLDVLLEAKERKVAIIGDMFELGDEEEQMHREIGIYAAGKSLDVIVCIGTLAKEYIQGIQQENSSRECVYFATLEEALEGLPSVLKEGDAILVKASHGMHFEKIVAQLKEM
ncbi:MAG: UDP-N-acetylmuramoyl-tripeptide--D-alanyl-D-alanine ligase [Lachnospiraceae bacterium]|nr:UDP-N-acetylmuramoyl-tripeptide--D-alanyl-D-alanine ligase [Lachnospiraceae bacterium]